MPTMQKDNPIHRSCPHCGVVLEKMPARKGKCPHCKEMVYPRYRPGADFKILMTEEQELANQKAWEDRNDRLKYGGMTELEAFSQLQVKAVQAANRQDYSGAMQPYFTLGEMRDIDQDARNEFRKQYIRMLLLRDQQSCASVRGFLGFKVNKNPTPGFNKGCPFKGGEMYTFDRAFKEMPIPCANEHCHCSYSTAFKQT